MTPSWRKPVGMLVILLLIALWCILAASASPIVNHWHPLVQALFYLVVGIVWIWVLPLRRLLVWMETGRWRR